MKKVLLILPLIVSNIYAQDSTISLFANSADSVIDSTKITKNVSDSSNSITNLLFDTAKNETLNSNKELKDSLSSVNKNTSQNSGVDSMSSSNMLKKSDSTFISKTESNSSVGTNSVTNVENIKKQISYIELLKNDNDEAVVKYKEAIKLNNSRKFSKSLDLFRYLLINFPNHPLAGNFQYWIGELEYKLHHYDSAIEALRNVSMYPNSPKTDDAQFLIVKCYRKMGLKNQAIAELETFFYKFPKSEYNRRARNIYNSLKQ